MVAVADYIDSLPKEKTPKFTSMGLVVQGEGRVQEVDAIGNTKMVTDLRFTPQTIFHKTGKVLLTIDIDDIEDVKASSIPADSWEELEALYRRVLPKTQFMVHRSISGKPKVSFLIEVKGDWAIDWSCEQRIRKAIKNALKVGGSKDNPARPDFAVFDGIEKIIDPAGAFRCFMTRSFYDVLAESFETLEPVRYHIRDLAAFTTVLNYAALKQEYRDQLRADFDLSKTQVKILEAYISISPKIGLTRYRRQVSQLNLAESVKRHHGMDKGISNTTVNKAFKAFRDKGLITLIKKGKIKKYASIYEVIDETLRAMIDRRSFYFQPLAGHWESDKKWLPLDGNSQKLFRSMVVKEDITTMEDALVRAKEIWGNDCLDIERREHYLSRAVAWWTEARKNPSKREMAEAEKLEQAMEGPSEEVEADKPASTIPRLDLPSPADSEAFPSSPGMDMLMDMGAGADGNGYF